MEKKTKNGDGRPVRRLTYPRIDDISPKTLEFFKNKRNVVTFLSEIVKEGGEMLATEALGYDWWDIEALLTADKAFQKLVEEQRPFILQRAEELICNRAINGYEEVVEEDGVIVKKTRKVSDRTLLSYLKANHPLYKGLPKDEEEEELPEVIIKRF